MKTKSVVHQRVFRSYQPCPLMYHQLSIRRLMQYPSKLCHYTPKTLPYHRQVLMNFQKRGSMRLLRRFLVYLAFHQHEHLVIPSLGQNQCLRVSHQVRLFLSLLLARPYPRQGLATLRPYLPQSLAMLRLCLPQSLLQSPAISLLLLGSLRVQQI